MSAGVIQTQILHENLIQVYVALLPKLKGDVCVPIFELRKYLDGLVLPTKEHTLWAPAKLFCL